MRKMLGILMPGVVMLFGSTLSGAEETILAESFEASPWQSLENGNSETVVRSVADVPELSSSVSNQSMELELPDGDGEYCVVAPANPIYVPGELKRVRIWTKANSATCKITLGFQDGWYHSANLTLACPVGKTDEWERTELPIPSTWRQPLALKSIKVEGADGAADKLKVQIDHIEVVTDLQNADQQTGNLKSWKPNPDERSGEKKIVPHTPLLGISVIPSELCGIFTEQSVKLDLEIRSWSSATEDARLQYRLTDYQGKVLRDKKVKFSFQGLYAKQLTFAPKQFGLYAMTFDLRCKGGKRIKKEFRLAYLPKPHKLTEQQRLDSPYGLNVHGGRAVLITPFTKAGITWFRDYVFNISHSGICRGDDGKWSGWPFLKPLVDLYKKHKVQILGCRQKGIPKLAIKDAKMNKLIPPSDDWKSEMTETMKQFPYIKYWELDNEYALKAGNREAEELVGFRHYGMYHQAFGQLVKKTSPELTAVENGSAGIWPDRIAEQVKRGAFKDIGVVNCHHYSGTEPAEINYGNFNTGFGGRKSRLFFDELRAVKRASALDGIKRQAWLTEFGWDTKAGHVVSHYQQAAYLSRGYMTFIAAGIDKAFWFFDIDSPNANQFFDGCGLLMHGPEFQPKLSLCAMAGLTHVLPDPEFIGIINVGKGTWGYVFKQDDEYVAALFSLVQPKGPLYTFNGGKVYDFLGNPMKSPSVRLGLEPVFAVGIPKQSELYRQTAYMLESDYLVNSCLGERVQGVLRVHNNRDEAISASAILRLPAGWTADKKAFSINVAPGKTKLIPFSCIVGVETGVGEHELTIDIDEKHPVKSIPIRVLVRPPAKLAIGGITGRPGDCTIEVKLGNQSNQPVSGELSLMLPKSWKTTVPKQTIGPIGVGQVKTVKLPVNWNTDLKAGETAQVQFRMESGFQARRPIIPNHWTIPRLDTIEVNGDLSEWPKDSAFPEWMLGSDLGKANGELRMGWSDKGLLLGLKTGNSKLMTADPKSFWNGDTIELLVDTSDSKRKRTFEAGDHHFWLVPQLDKGKVYLGQWKHGKEIPKTRYDIKSIQGTAKKAADGYVMEVLIPASELKGFSPLSGKSLGVAVIVTVHGHDHKRQIYWPIPKTREATTVPGTWGSLELK